MGIPMADSCQSVIEKQENSAKQLTFNLKNKYILKSTGVGCHFLFQGIFPTQGSNLGFPHCRQMPYPLSYQGSPTLKQFVSLPFSF